MKIGIDASNIVSGGGLNHIVELLSNYELQNNKILKERTEFEDILRNNLDVMIVGENISRLDHVSNIQFKGIHSETLMVALDLQGLGVSRGSACASGAQKPSHVLQAMKISDDLISWVAVDGSVYERQ